MINPDFVNGNNVSVMVDGKVIGEAKSLSYDHEVKPVGRPIPRYEGSFTVTGGITKAGGDFFNSLFNPAFDIEVQRVVYTPPRRLRSKKKRLIRKWRKKYMKVNSQEVYKNCTIEGVNDDWDIHG